MNNQFTPRVSDIINYSKEEANRLNNSYIGPEHFLYELSNFEEFMEKRQELMSKELKKILL